MLGQLKLRDLPKRGSFMNVKIHLRKKQNNIDCISMICVKCFEICSVTQIKYSCQYHANTSTEFPCDLTENVYYCLI